ncbi:hypothetical protein FZEAL_9876 [Fusarium zealandicum]|uniref:F-box domain-containing protein n=1 Tax=Fusarium zealandicum TaxID=1053134 RepID=A0A8H4XEJ5_9HYPO|nr:hypothetical protein FZEAL_9876 [Fusarium zealandicum]
MGYSEVLCHICGVSFNISRFRTGTEPRAAAWTNTGDGKYSFVQLPDIYYYMNHAGCSRDSGCFCVERPSDGEPDSMEITDSAYEPLEATQNDSTWELDSNYESESGSEDSQDESDSSSTASEHLYHEFKSYFDDTSHGETGFSEQTKIFTDEGEAKISAIERVAELEHIAGRHCKMTKGYNGHYISVEAMRGCNTFQCLVRKPNRWESEPNDEEFETRGDFFLSGLSDVMASRDGSHSPVFPERHGCREPYAENYIWVPETADEYAMPFHPTCLEVFKRASLFRYGLVDLECLTQWWALETRSNNFDSFPRHDAVKAGRVQWWEHNRGDEFLAANPCFVPGLDSILSAAASDEDHQGCGLEHMEGIQSGQGDIFTGLPSEIQILVLSGLRSRDIANLRLASRAFRRLPQSLFYNLTLREMPWLYEAWSSLPLSFWATTTESELKKRHQDQTDQMASLQSTLRVLQKDARNADEPGFNNTAIEAVKKQIFECRSEFDTMRPTTSVPLLSRTETNWYGLQTDLKRNRKALLGLRNRRRIWKDCQMILSRVDKYRQQGKMLPGEAIDVVEISRLAL